MPDETGLCTKLEDVLRVLCPAALTAEQVAQGQPVARRADCQRRCGEDTTVTGP